MARQRHLLGRLRSTRGWRRRVGWLIVAALVAVVAGFIYLSRPQRLARHAADLLERISGAEATIELAHLALTGEIELEHVSLSVPGSTDNAGKIFEAERVVIRPDLASLVTGRFNAKTIVMLRPMIYLTEYIDREDLRYNFELLAREEEDKPMPSRLPAIFVRHGTVRFNVIEDGRFRTLDHIQLDGRLNESAQDPGSYSFALRQQTEDNTPGPRLFGRFNLQQQTVSVELEDFEFHQPQRNFLPHRLRAWWDRLDPRGELSTVQFSYSPDTGLSADLSLQDGELTLFTGESDFETRMTNVTVAFDIDGGRIQVANLSGLIEGIRYQISGVWEGFEPLAPFDLTVLTEPFEVAERPRLVFGLPPYIRKQYERFSPSGLFSAAVHVQRRRHGGAISYDGRVDLLNIKGRYHKFPYPLENVKGVLLFNDRRVTLTNVTGHGPDGAMVTINGLIEPPGDQAKVELDIVATDLSIDDSLFQAMEPQHRGMLELFFDRDAHRRLVEQGVIRTNDPRLRPFMPERFAIENPKRFDLGGKVDVNARLLRPAGPDQKYHTGLRVDVKSVNALFGQWPYPLEIASGRVQIDAGKATISKLAIRGPTGATAILDGEITPKGPDGKFVPELKISSARVPLDHYLIASIPSPQDVWVRDLRLTGTAEGAGTVTADDEQNVQFDIQVVLNDATMTPFGGAFTLSDIEGEAAIQSSRVTVNRLEGRYRDGVVTVNGAADWSRHDPVFRVQLTGENLSISRDMLDLVPPAQPQRLKLVELFDAYKPEGLFDMQVSLGGKLDMQELDYAVVLQPKHLAFDFKEQRLGLTDMTGQVSIQPDTIELHQLAARTEHGQFTVNGFIQHGEQRGASLSFTAQADRIDQATRALLPETGRNILDNLSITGGYRIVDGRVVTRPDIQQGPVLEFESRVRLANASANVGLPIEKLFCRFDLRVVQFAGQTWPYIDMRLDADRLRAAERLVQPMTLRLSTGSRPDTLILTECSGQVYGGAMVGSGLVQLGKDGFYRLDLRVHDADVNPFIYPNKQQPVASRADAPDDELPPGMAPLHDQQADTGDLSASIILEADIDDPASRRGRGELKIVDAQLFENPLSLALLQAANFNLPTTRSFDRASASYLIDGDTILFDEVRMESPNFAVIGSGTMDFPTRRLDLTLNTREVGGLRLGALSEMFDVFKDELVTIRVTGTMDDPQTSAAPLIGFRRSLHALFSKKKKPQPAQREPDNN